MQSTVKKTSYNFLFGLLGQLVSILCGIVVPRFFIVSFGSETNGFINSINQIFVYVALLEAGVGAASLQALYKPIADDDKKSINRILAATHFYYKRTGVYYVLLIGAVAFIYPLLVKTSLPYPVMVGIVLFSGMGGALTYFFQSKYKLLLQAEGKNYISANVATANAVLLSVGKVVFLSLGFPVLAVQSIYLVLSFLQSLYMVAYIKRHYKWIDLKCEPDFKATEQKNAVLMLEIATLVFHNTDVLILTAFCDLKTVSIYATYKYVVNMMSTVLSNISTSVKFKLGQMFSVKEQFLPVYDLFETAFTALTFVLGTIACFLMLPFMRLYTEGMDANYILNWLPVLIVAGEVLCYGRTPQGFLVAFAGHFEKTKYRALLEAILNLGTSLLLVQWLGIYGVLGGTVIALLYRTNDMIIYTNKAILGRSPWKTYRIWGIELALSSVLLVLLSKLPLEFSSYVSVICCGAVLLFVIGAILFAGAFLADRKSASVLTSLFKQVVKRGNKS